MLSKYSKNLESFENIFITILDMLQEKLIYDAETKNIT